MTAEQKEQHRPGTLRYQDQSGTWQVTAPHSPMYSTATMLATEYWDSKTEQWKPILWD